MLLFDIKNILTIPVPLALRSMAMKMSNLIRRRGLLE